MKIASIVSLATLAVALVAGGCKSTHEEGVKSNLMKQWTTVNANTDKATGAATAVLEEEKLMEIKHSSTALDGMASGKKSDGSTIDVRIKKMSDDMSQVSVSVGKMGDPEVGAALAKRIKMKAEGN